MPAEGFSNFGGLVERETTVDERNYVALLPAGGWRVRYEASETAPLVGWALRQDRDIEPVHTDGPYGVIGGLPSDAMVYHEGDDTNRPT